MTTTEADSPTSLKLEDLRASWVWALRSASRSQGTIDSYLLALDQFANFLVAEGASTAIDSIKADHVGRYLTSVYESRASATARQRYASLQQFWKWAVAEGESMFDPMANMPAPKVDEKPVPVLSTADIKALLAACVQARPGREARISAVRDEAMIRLLLDCGLRLSELTNLKTTDIDWTEGTVTVLGKGRRVRSVPFGPATGQALNRWIRKRRLHDLADRPEVWLGRKGPLSGSGVHQALNRRAEMAGIGHVHPHQLRHTFAHRWLAAGGAETDVMRLAGWSSPQMLRRYGASAADERARDTHRRLNLGDF